MEPPSIVDPETGRAAAGPITDHRPPTRSWWQREPGPEALWWRLVVALVVLVLPIVSFPIGAELGPEWQTGNVSDRVALLLVPDATVYFAPFIVVAWFATLAAILGEGWTARFRLLRLAVYSGVPLTLQFLIVSSIVGVGFPVAATMIVLAIVFALRWLGGLLTPVARTRLIGGVLALIAAAITIAVPAALLGAPEPAAVLIAPLGLIVLGLLFAGPGLCASIAAHRSWRLARVARTARTAGADPVGAGSRAGYGVAVIAWLGAYLFAWQRSAQEAIEQYEALPTEPPMCFIATAAAEGHPRVVGSWRSTTSTGRSFGVTRQLQHCKAGELALRAAAPRLHRRLRLVYNRIGPPMAAWVAASPIRADVAHVALKPVEWTARFLLAVSGPEARRAAVRLYRH